MRPPSVDGVADLERGMWEAARARRFDVIASHLAADYVGIYEPGVRKVRAEMLAGLPDLRVDAVRLDDVAVTALAPTVALVTYTLHVEGAVGREPLHASCLASALWCWRGAAWVNVYYQETPIQSGAPEASR